MTESTPAESSMTPGDTPPSEGTSEPVKPAESQNAAAGAGGTDAAGEDGVGEGTVVKGRRVLLVVGAVAVLMLLALAVVAVFVLKGEERGEAGECVRDSVVVACTEPHEARIVQVVEDANGCSPPATHAMKEADRRYLCLVEEPG